MQNNIAQSSLLQSYLANAGVTPNAATVQPQTYVTSPVNAPKLQQPTADTFTPQSQSDTDKSTKKNIAKAALAASIIIGTGAIIVAAFRNNGGLIKTVKEKAGRIKDFIFSKGQEAGGKFDGQFAKVPDFSAGADNVTNVKDVSVRHFLKRFPLYEKFDNAITGFYKKTVLQTMKRNYGRAAGALDLADDVILKNLDDCATDPKIADRIRELIQKRNGAIKDFTSSDAITSRFQRLNDSMSDLDESGWKKLWGFIKNRDLKGAMKNLATENVVESRLAKCKEVQKGLLSGFEHCGLDEKEACELRELLGHAFKEKNPEILREASKAESGLIKAFSKEGKDLFYKLRDINCGSAPTDIEGMILTAGALGIYTAQADTKSERVGVTLTTGIPLLATVGTTILATCNMVSGAKAFGLGAAAGFAVKKVCGAINKKYQAKHAEDGQPPENTIVTIDDYLKTINDMRKSN